MKFKSAPLDTIDATLEISLASGRDIEVEATFEYEGGMDGIGPYECHGYKGFDKGEWQVEGTWFKSFICEETLTEEEKKEVEIFCENYAESGDLDDKIRELQADTCADGD